MNYTTVEQSKKLLELGLSPDSADILILNNVGRSGKVDDTNYTIILKENLNPLAKVPEIIPCWSVGRLIELMPYRIFDNGASKYLSIVKDESDTFCITYYDITIAAFEDITSACFKTIVWLIENHYINKL